MNVARVGVVYLNALVGAIGVLSGLGVFHEEVHFSTSFGMILCYMPTRCNVRVGMTPSSEAINMGCRYRMDSLVPLSDVRIRLLHRWCQTAHAICHEDHLRLVPYLVHGYRKSNGRSVLWLCAVRLANSRTHSIAWFYG